MIWLVIALLSTLVLFALAQPFFSKHADHQTLNDRDYLLAQIKEIETSGNGEQIAENEKKAALLEAHRRLLSADNNVGAESKKAASGFWRHASIILVALVPVAAAGVYMVLGNPGLEPKGQQPTEAQAAAPDLSAMTQEDRAAMINNMVAGLAARLAQSPDDLEGWLMLGRSYGVQGELQKSAEAYGRAAALAPDNLDIRVAHLQSLLSTLDPRDPVITGPLVEALQEVERLDADHPLSLYFLGQAAEQRGEPETARVYWERLETTMPPRSDAALSLRKMIDAL